MLTILRHYATHSRPIVRNRLQGIKVVPDQPRRSSKSKTHTETGHSAVPADRKGAYGMRINQLFNDAIRDIEEQMRDPRRKRIH